MEGRDRDGHGRTAAVGFRQNPTRGLTNGHEEQHKCMQSLHSSFAMLILEFRTPNQ